MPNKFKYNKTGSESNSLFKGNWAIDISGFSQGPTSTTGFYNGVDVPTDGYIIYNSGLAFTANSDQDLLDYTNSLGGDGSSVANALTWLDQQSTIAVVNKDYESIVTEGLVSNIDAGFTSSYPRTGSILYDLIGPNNGALNNNPTFDSDGSISFDGTNDYINCGAQSNLNNITDVSVAVWVYPIGIQSQNINAIINRYGNNTSSNGWQLNYRQSTENSNIQFNWGGRESSAEFLSTGTSYSFTLNNWYFVCATKEGDLWKVYVNGELKASQNTGVGTTPFASNKTYLAAFPQFNYYTNTKIAKAQIYNRALSADEVLQNFTTQKTIFPIGIVNENIVLHVDAGSTDSYPGSGTTWTDLSGNGYDAVLVNGPSYSTDGGGSFYFDGANDYAYLETITYGGGSTVSELTVTTWMKTSVTGSNTGDGSFNSDQWAFLDFDRSDAFNFYIESGGQLKFSGYSSNSGGLPQYYDLGAGTSTLFNDNQWHHIAVTFSVADQEIKFYGDGVLLRTVTANGSMTALGAGATRYGFIGDGSESGSQNSTRNNAYYQGQIASVVLYDGKALTDTEILRNFNSQRARFGV